MYLKFHSNFPGANELKSFCGNPPESNFTASAWADILHDAFNSLASEILMKF